MPIVEKVEGRCLVENDDRPKRGLVARLGNLMVESTLCEESSRPSAEQLCEMQGGFGRPPPVGLGSPLILPVKPEGETGNDREITENKARVKGPRQS